MHHVNKYIDIEDRSADLDNIYKEIEKLELGLRAVCVMYNDHSDDINSRKNIFRLKDNIYYRLTSARHQCRLLLEELFRSEKYLEQLVKKDGNALNGFLFNNPHFQKLEADISSVFDGLIFQIASIFDYFSHIVCYICKKIKMIHCTGQNLQRQREVMVVKYPNCKLQKLSTTLIEILFANSMIIVQG